MRLVVRTRTHAQAAPGGPTIAVTVLTTGCWPSQPCPACVLPLEVSASAAHFEAFYLGRHTGRRLSWQTNVVRASAGSSAPAGRHAHCVRACACARVRAWEQGTADVRVLFGGRRHELTVTTYQMCILMLFNARDRWSYMCARPRCACGAGARCDPPQRAGTSVMRLASQRRT